MMLFIASLLFALAIEGAHTTPPKIVYKVTQEYDLIWNYNDDYGAFWRPQNYEQGYCVLGDVGTRGSSNPTSRAIVVKAIDDDALVHPESFTEVWSYNGDVSMYTMNAPGGYRCLGGAAMPSDEQPDKSKYCCVKNEYTVLGGTSLFWSATGRGWAEFSAWETMQGVDAWGMNSGNFIPTGNYDQPQAAYLLEVDGEDVRDVWSWPQQLAEKPLKLYEETNVRKIWDNARSGSYIGSYKAYVGSYKVSIWRAVFREGFYSLGDIAENSHTEPAFAFIARLNDPDDSISLRNPTGYNKLWSDAGFNSDMHCAIWRANCPGGYRALGHVTTDGEEPELNAIKCVLAEYTRDVTSSAWQEIRDSSDAWQYIWHDTGIADTDIALYEATAATPNQQSIRAYSAVTNYDSYPGTSYLLKNTAYNYFAEKPVRKYKITSIDYHLAEEDKSHSPVTMAPTTIENNSGIQQTTVRQLTFTISISATFSWSITTQIGVEAKLTAGIPLITSAETTVSASVSSTFTIGATIESSTADTIRAQIIAPNNTRMTAYIEAQKFTSDIPYTAQVKKYYYDGTTADAVVSGVYRGVAVSQAVVRYTDPEPITGGTLVRSTCPSSHPYVYHDGDYCCHHAIEKTYSPHGARCDGGLISFDSSCCRDDAYRRCSTHICDNSEPIWTLVYRHDISGGYFGATDNILTGVNKDDPDASLYSRLDELDNLSVDGASYHFKYVDAAGPIVEWVQSSNPTTASDILGFVAVAVPDPETYPYGSTGDFGGIGLNLEDLRANTLIDSAPNSNYWFMGLGNKVPWNGQIPGWGTSATSRVELYVQSEEEPQVDAALD